MMQFSPALELFVLRLLSARPQRVFFTLARPHFCKARGAFCSRALTGSSNRKETPLRCLPERTFSRLSNRRAIQLCALHAFFVRLCGCSAPFENNTHANRLFVHLAS